MAYGCLALLILLVHTVPGKSDFLDDHLGTYESLPEDSNNFDKFSEFLGLNVSSNPVIVQFFKQSDGVHYKVYLGSSSNLITELLLVSNQKQTVSLTGHPFECDLRNDQERTVFFNCRPRDNGQRFTVKATFLGNTINATYIRGDVVAERIYRRIPNPAILGYYEKDPGSQSSNWADFVKKHLPIPKGASVPENTALWIGRRGRDFVWKTMLAPNVHDRYQYQLDQERIQTIDGQNYTYKVLMQHENMENGTTILRLEYCGTDDSFALISEYTPKGLNTTLTSGNETASAYWKRVPSYLMYGRFVHVPSAQENWAEIIRVTGREDDSQRNKVVVIHRSGQKSYLTVYLDGKADHTLEIKPNEWLTGNTANGRSYQYRFTEKPSFTNQPLLEFETKSDPNASASVIIFRFSMQGLHATYRVGNVTAKRFFRRNIPDIALGKFKAGAPSGDYTNLFTSVLSEFQNLHNLRTIELARHGEDQYLDSTTYTGVEAPAQFPFKLGQLNNVTIDDQVYQYMYSYFDYPAPILNFYWRQPSSAVDRAVFSCVFESTGMNCTVMAGGRVVFRRHERIGNPAIADVHPTV